MAAHVIIRSLKVTRAPGRPQCTASAPCDWAASIRSQQSSPLWKSFNLHGKKQTNQTDSLIRITPYQPNLLPFVNLFMHLDICSQWHGRHELLFCCSCPPHPSPSLLHSQCPLDALGSERKQKNKTKKTTTL